VAADTDLDTSLQLQSSEKHPFFRFFILYYSIWFRFELRSIITEVAVCHFTRKKYNQWVVNHFA
jgi:hypothetical protein